MAARSLLDSRMLSRRSLRNVAFAYRGYRARSRLPPPADFHSPRSTDSSSSFSSASSFIVALFTEIVSFVAFRLGMIVFRKTVCSSSTSASARSATARPRRSPRRKLAGEGGNGTRYT